MGVVGTGRHDALALRRTLHGCSILWHAGIAVDDGIAHLDGKRGTFRYAVVFTAGNLCAVVKGMLIGLASAVYAGAVDAVRLIAQVQAVITITAAFCI